MNVSATYTPLLGSRLLPPERAHFFFTDALLYARLECGYPTNCERFDEDVNVYLADLLAARMSPRSDTIASMARFQPELLEASYKSDRRGSYELYKRCADELLFALGIFRNPRGRRPDSVEHLALPRNAYIGRGKIYYAIASSHAASLVRRPNAVSSVLEKLSIGFERYMEVLSYMAVEYLGIVKEISVGELYHLQRSAFCEADKNAVAEAYDRFLDRYSAYKRNPTSESRELLYRAAESLRSLDPSFKFDLESVSFVRGS